MAKPKLCLIPATVGGKVYSILPSDGVGDFDFTRADGSSPTGVTRINAQGLIEEVASGVNRLNYSLLDGEVVGCPHLLLEPQRINDLQRSQEFDNAYWTKYQTSVSANSFISPDGTLNADKLIEDNSNSTHQLGRAISYNSGTTYTISVFAKSSDRNLEIGAGNTNTFPAKAIFDLSNGTVLSSTLGNPSIENYGNGWYRCIITATALATSTTNINFGLTNGSTLSYSGNGVSFIELFGAMREQGSYPTSYIKTTSAAVTRAAETCTGSGNAATFNDSEGVLMAEISALADDATERRITISNSSNTSELILIEYDTPSNTLHAFLYDGSFQAEFTHTLNDITTFAKVGFKYKANDFALWVNGFEVGTDNIGNVFPNNTLDVLKFENSVSLNKPFYGKTKQIQYFDTTDIDLEQLTSWDSFRAMAEGQLYTIQ